MKSSNAIVLIFLAFSFVFNNVSALVGGEPTNAHPYFVVIVWGLQHADIWQQPVKFCPGVARDRFTVITAMSCLRDGEMSPISTEVLDKDNFKPKKIHAFQCSFTPENLNLTEAWTEETAWDNTHFNLKHCHHRKVLSIVAPEFRSFQYLKRRYWSYWHNLALLTVEAPFDHYIYECDYTNYIMRSSINRTDTRRRAAEFNSNHDMWVVSIGFDLDGKPTRGLAHKKVNISDTLRCRSRSTGE